MEKGKQISVHDEIIEKMSNDRIDERFERMRMEFREELASIHNQQHCTSIANDRYYRQQNYIQTLVEVSSRTDHRVHEEIAEAVKTLKELTYTTNQAS